MGDYQYRAVRVVDGSVAETLRTGSTAAFAAIPLLGASMRNAAKIHRIEGQIRMLQRELAVAKATEFRVERCTIGAWEPVHEDDDQ